MVAVIGSGAYWLLRKATVGEEKANAPLLSGEAHQASGRFV
jgi:hypothetical protein